MSYEISKELFEAIMSLDSGRINVFDSSITYNYGHNCISINDFFFKCKEWAYNQGYIIYSSTKSCSMFKKEAQLYCSNEDIQEQQKIFDACQWILDKDKQ